MKYSSLLCFVMLASTGCNWLNSLRPNNPEKPTGKLEAKPADDFVRFLNRQSNYVKTVRYDNVSLSASIPGQFVPRLTSGMIVAAKPSQFRMQAGLPFGGDQLDVGSNSQEFWMYVKQSNPKYLYCSHADFAKVQDQLPVPFEPDWVLQALGITTFPETRNYRIETSERDHAYYLSWEDTTANGQRVLKIVEFAGERATSTTPQVRRHLVLAPTKSGGWETIASAEIKQVITKEVGSEPGSNQGVYVQIPTNVILEWPTQKMKMELSLGRVKINEVMTRQDESALFEKPAKLDNSSPINLAELRFNAGPSNTPRGAYPGDLPSPSYDRKR